MCCSDRYRSSADLSRCCTLLEGPALFARRLHVANSYPFPFPVTTSSGLVARHRPNSLMPAELPAAARFQQCATSCLQSAQIIDDFRHFKVLAVIATVHFTSTSCPPGLSFQYTIYTIYNIFWTPFADLEPVLDYKWALACICFSFFFYFCLWLSVLD